MTKQHTRVWILEQGAKIIVRKGFHHTGIQEILQAAAIPKGSFYFYFANKEDFGLHLIDYYGEKLLAWASQYLESDNSPALVRLRRFFDSSRSLMEENKCQGGCPLGNLAQEMSDQNEKFREKLTGLFHCLKQAVERCLELAKTRGEIPATIHVGDIAEFLINSWEGALLATKLTKNTSPLDNFDRIIFDYVLLKQ